jgi:hypothetical protein
MVEWSRRQRWFNSGIASQADAERTACAMPAVPRDGNIPRAAKQAEIVSGPARPPQKPNNGCGPAPIRFRAFLTALAPQAATGNQSMATRAIGNSRCFIQIVDPGTREGGWLRSSVGS